MERLTERYKDPIANTVLIKECGDKLCKNICDDIECDCSKCGLEKALEKLADYEDLEEQGLLVRIPCKVGDTVWELCLCDDGNYRIFPMIVKTISEYGTLKQVKKDITIWNIYAESDYTYMYKSFADFRKTVFSTKEEAEKKLEEMKK